MARARDPNRDHAKEIWLEHGGDITNRRIAEMLGVDEKKIAVWKQRDKWNVVQQKRGAPKGNKYKSVTVAVLLKVECKGETAAAPAGHTAIRRLSPLGNMKRF
ncbi:phage terminase small subunit-related protein [Paenibacillus lentus]|uniref:phage terminase small subunit-related protein n=1 Tax=Paenibacillus lentus TaxID=1338368 RepID=UPI001FE95CA2|nr:phage terminase small subunit-related protein [Paenibacillus lentus]